MVKEDERREAGEKLTAFNDRMKSDGVSGSVFMIEDILEMREHYTERAVAEHYGVLYASVRAVTDLYTGIHEEGVQDGVNQIYSKLAQIPKVDWKDKHWLMECGECGVSFRARKDKHVVRCPFCGSEFAEVGKAEFLKDERKGKKVAKKRTMKKRSVYRGRELDAPRGKKPDLTDEELAHELGV